MKYLRGGGSSLEVFQTNGLFTLLDADSGTDSDSDPKSYGHIVLHRPCLYSMDFNSEPNPDLASQLLLYSLLEWIYTYLNWDPSLLSGNVNKPKKSIL